MEAKVKHYPFSLLEGEVGVWLKHNNNTDVAVSVVGTIDCIHQRLFQLGAHLIEFARDDIAFALAIIIGRGDDVFGQFAVATTADIQSPIHAR